MLVLFSFFLRGQRGLFNSTAFLPGLVLDLPLFFRIHVLKPLPTGVRNPRILVGVPDRGVVHPPFLQIIITGSLPKRLHLAFQKNEDDELSVDMPVALLTTNVVKCIACLGVSLL